MLPCPCSASSLFPFPLLLLLALPLFRCCCWLCSAPAAVAAAAGRRFYALALSRAPASPVFTVIKFLSHAPPQSIRSAHASLPCLRIRCIYFGSPSLATFSSSAPSAAVPPFICTPYKPTHTHTHTHIFVYVYMYFYMYIHIYICIYLYRVLFLQASLSLYFIFN